MDMHETPIPVLAFMLAVTAAGQKPDKAVVQSLTAELEGRLSTEVDGSGGPADMDQALAKFLLAYIRTK